MGYLGEIERRRQQQIQDAQAQKVEFERQKQIQAQEILDKEKSRKQQDEKNSSGFIREVPVIASLLDQLDQFGYKDYFENVSRLSGFGLKNVLYMGYPKSPFFGVSPEVEKMQSGAKEKLKLASSKLGWRIFIGQFGIEKHWDYNCDPINPNMIFFGDNVTTAEQKRLTESKEVGIGIRFAKLVESRERGHGLKSSLFKQDHDYVIEEWFHAAYMRINPHSRVTITGSSQRQVDLRDIKLVDEALHQAIRNPATFYTSKTHTWKAFSYGSSEEHPTG